MTEPRNRPWIHRGALAACVAGVLAIAVACGSGGASSGPTSADGSGSGGDAGEGAMSVRVGYHPDLHGAGIIAIGQEQGYWKQVGLDVHAKEFSNGVTEIQALAGGDIDIGYIGPGTAWLPASGRATILTVDSFSNGDYVIGQPDITSLKDLKGKKVGYPEATSGEMILRLALREAGLSMADIKKVPLKPEAVVPAFVNKKIDVAAIWVPLAQEIRDKVPEAQFLAVDNDFSPEYKFPESWIGSNSFVQQHPDTVKKFLKGFALASDYRMKHISDAVNVTSKFTDVPKDALQAQAKGTIWMSSDDMAKAYTSGKADKWFRKLEQLFHSMGKLDKVVPPSQFTNFDLFIKATQ